ncbi:hypothetical protein GUITHDRAFT_138833 [Guillardia theta CCMP2712]|uniref:Uncharacterized protein n=1 Tax=Guillardia theta (strain CCMP2712) TaxID=905079 RepID=L1JAP2_GUITC|nr:hypothetical protein GUITHDRAFT_138833 [Guillardia theta CCMP2712]EKX45613.1 hypothetical protein GUITHDRAFT_138833 [Guillardia theta CCMP2712]|eukprot:XP_005832593.1 hypothetical protein GUITHDRAFT_138833 [Guillardia theta CCMP2712]
MLISVLGFLRYFGAVPGYRDTAYELLKSGNWVAVVPGGAEEIMAHSTCNGRSAYVVSWVSKSGKKRAGFARVALKMGKGFQIFPCFCENGEEMKFNLFFELWTFLRLDILVGIIIRLTPDPMRWLLMQLAIIITFNVSCLSLPLPVKVTQHIGDPVIVQEDDTEETLAERVEKSLQSLIQEKQGRTHRSFISALQSSMKEQSFKLE